MRWILAHGLSIGVVLACACQAAPPPLVSDEASALPLTAAGEPCEGVWFGRACGADGNVHACVAGRETEVTECPFHKSNPEYTCSIDDWGQAYCTFVPGCRRDSECWEDLPDGTELSCLQPICVDADGEEPGRCEHPALRQRTPCREEAGMCDGKGHCVDCLEDADCKSGVQPYCYMNRCIGG